MTVLFPPIDSLRSTLVPNYYCCTSVNDKCQVYELYIYIYLSCIGKIYVDFWECLWEQANVPAALTIQGCTSQRKGASVISKLVEEGTVFLDFDGKFARIGHVVELQSFFLRFC